jgi:hypothetical protein
VRAPSIPWLKPGGVSTSLSRSSTCDMRPPRHPVLPATSPGIAWVRGTRRQIPRCHKGARAVLLSRPPLPRSATRCSSRHPGHLGRPPGGRNTSLATGRCSVCALVGPRTWWRAQGECPRWPWTVDRHHPPDPCPLMVQPTCSLPFLVGAQELSKQATDQSRSAADSWQESALHHLSLPHAADLASASQAASHRCGCAILGREVLPAAAGN